VLFEDLVRHAGSCDERGVRVDVGLHAEHAAEVEDDGKGYGCGSGRGGSRHLSIMTCRV
jgi:hypothetical protein